MPNPTEILPPEIIDQPFNYLENKDLAQASRVCRSWHTIASQQKPLRATESPYPKLMCELIMRARYAFLNSREITYLTPKVRLYTCQVNGEQYRFFGIHKNAQKSMKPKDFLILRQRILQVMGFSPSSPTIQIVGDSATFWRQEAQIYKRYLFNKLAQIPNLVVLYGFTGNRKDDGLEVNELVAEWIAQDQTHQGRNVLANIVDFHSSKAMLPKNIGGWGGAISPMVRNFYLVYDYGHIPTSESGAKFGDDTLSSDNLTSEACLCLEGGAQSFRQVMIMLANNIRVEGVTGLRGENNPKVYATDRGRDLFCFSAAEFLNYIAQHINDIQQTYHRNITLNEIETIKDAYFSTHYLIASQPNIKSPMFQLAWSEFTQRQLWKKIPQFYQSTNVGQLK
jgi:hypothetical protein